MDREKGGEKCGRREEVPRPWSNSEQGGERGRRGGGGSGVSLTGVHGTAHRGREKGQGQC